MEQDSVNMDEEPAAECFCKSPPFSLPLLGLSLLPMSNGGTDRKASSKSVSQLATKFKSDLFHQNRAF